MTDLSIPQNNDLDLSRRYWLYISPTNYGDDELIQSFDDIDVAESHPINKKWINAHIWDDLGCNIVSWNYDQKGWVRYD